MALRLRAYLMLRSPEGEWDIEVSDVLEDVVQRWENKTDADISAVLHVGFERRVAKSFDDLATQFSGQVLLTSGAKNCLPRAFLSSNDPIATIDDDKIYLALEGWGYSASSPETTLPRAALPDYEGWLYQYVKQHPEDVGTLQQANVVNDDTYLANESKITADVRQQLANVRFNYLLEGASDDPCAVAVAAPPWLKEREFESLSLTVRLGNVFRKNSIEKVADLCRYTMADLMCFSNFGRTSRNDLVEILRRELAVGPRSLAREIEQPESATLLAAVRQSLLNFDERERDILHRRMGLDCRRETLEEIGGSYGITRERIRQIEARTVSRLIQQELWDDVLAAKLRKLLAEREFPLPLMGVEAVDSWFEGAAQNRDAISYLLSNLGVQDVSLVDVEGIEYLAFIDQEKWEAMLVSARRILAGGTKNAWTRADCKRHVQALLPTNANEFKGLLWERVCQPCQFSDNTDTGTLVAFGKGAEQIVEAVLSESNEPLHYSDIAIKATKRAGRDIDERRAHSAAAEVGYLFDRGMYGLLKHVPATPEVMEQIADEVTEIVNEGPVGRQWHTYELLDMIASRGTTISDGITKYVLDIALKRQGELHSFGRMIWASPEESQGHARVEIRQAVIAILQQAGHPLTSNQLRQRLVALRGINHEMQFAVSDPIIKLDSSVWALNDRDLGVKRNDQAEMMDQVVAILKNHGRPVHIDECKDLFDLPIPSRALFCLAAEDDRLQTNIGRQLSLRG